MKLLTLVRHAKSSWKDMSLSDFDRPLNKRGERDAPVMGERLAERERPDLLVSSPAVRAATTARVVAGKLEYAEDEIRFDERIYDAGIHQLLEVIGEIEDAVGHLMMFGHNPGFTDLCNHLSGNGHIDNIPTCGIALIRFEVESWGKVDRLDGELMLFDFPKNEG